MEIDKQNTTIIITIIIMLFGTLCVLSLSNIEITFKTEMDENTLDYLTEHDYCIYTIQPPYDSSESGYVFMGDCKYINQTLLGK